MVLLRGLRHPGGGQSPDLQQEIAVVRAQSPHQKACSARRRWTCDAETLATRHAWPIYQKAYQVCHHLSPTTGK